MVDGNLVTIVGVVSFQDEIAFFEEIPARACHRVI